MFSIFGFLLAILASAIFIEAYVIIPNDSGRVTGNNFPPSTPAMMPGNLMYPQMTPQQTMQGIQPQFISDPSNSNGVNAHIFPQQISPIMQGNAYYNPYMTNQQEVQRSQQLPPMLDPIMQGYQYNNQIPLSLPIPIDNFSQQVAFLIQSAAARLRTYITFANQYIPNFSYNGPFMNNMSQTGYYPKPYSQQFQPVSESQEVLGEEMLETQLKNAKEQQQVIENDHRPQDEYENELENKRKLQLEEEEIEKEKKEAEEKIQQEQQEEKEREEREQKLREEQELRLIQIEAEKSNKKAISDMKKKVMQKPRIQKPVKPIFKPKVSETSITKPPERQKSEVTDIEEQIKSLSQLKNIKPQNLAKPGKY